MTMRDDVSGAGAPVDTLEDTTRQVPQSEAADDVDLRDRYRDERYRDDPRDRYRDGPGFVDDAARFARRHIRTPETKEFFKTSEFFLTLIGAIVLIVASAAQGTFDANEMWPLFTFLLAAYVLSRGIAKSGARRDR